MRPVFSRIQKCKDGECYVEPQGEKRRPGSPVYTNLKELKVTVRSPPSPTAPPVQILDLWERHICPDTGRNFYLNSVTKERTWKPPRRTRNRVQSR
ncbi:rho GTPase-activating protein 9-like, partial [Rhincodon typus]|uniref:rho GTPase-activating protein 9-like n=1 Tax=Rhincodon typus TaxID=259920 RepID=UPI00202F0F35